MELQELKMRLDNLEKKMDDVVLAVSILPRIEERMINQKNDLSDHEERLRRLEKTTNESSVYKTWIERAVFVIIALALGGMNLFK
jgi:hypothetical protein